MSGRSTPVVSPSVTNIAEMAKVGDGPPRLCTAVHTQGVDLCSSEGGGPNDASFLLPKGLSRLGTWSSTKVLRKWAEVLLGGQRLQPSSPVVRSPPRPHGAWRSTGPTPHHRPRGAWQLARPCAAVPLLPLLCHGRTFGPRGGRVPRDNAAGRGRCELAPRRRTVWSQRLSPLTCRLSSMPSCQGSRRRHRR